MIMIKQKILLKNELFSIYLKKIKMEYYFNNIYKDNDYLPEEGDLMDIDELVLLIENTQKV